MSRTDEPSGGFGAKPMTSNADGGVAEADSSRMRRVVVAGAVGSAVEYYDFGVYGYLATTLAVVFFPASDPTAGLLATFAIFAVAFFVRPLGAVIFGHVGDRFGRRGALAATVISMAAATFAIGLMPGYAALGTAAAALLVLARCAQGISAGGEISGAASFVGEHSPIARRGFLCSTTEFGALAGQLAAVLTVAGLSLLLTQDQMTAWGWRIPFLIALPLGLIGLYIRYRIEESPEFERIEEKQVVARAPVLEVLTQHWRPLLKVIGLSIMVQSGYYMAFVYSNAHLQQAVGLSATAASWSTTLALFVAVLAIPVFGVLSDRVGRKPVLAAGSAGFVLLSYPAFILMSLGGILFGFLGQLVLCLLTAVIMGAIFSTFAEQFGTRTRYSGFALGFSVGAAVGGTAPYVASWLVANTGSAISPALFVVVAGVVALIAVFTLQETANRPLPEQ